MAFERDNITALHAYVPGEQPTAVQTAAGQIIKLNTNENAYPPSPSVMTAIAQVSAEALRLYPSAASDGFRAIAAALHKLDVAQVIATNGGDELLRLLVTVYCQPACESVGGLPQGGGLGMSDPSYSLYGVLAGIHDTPVVTVSRDDEPCGGFALPQDYMAQLNAAGCQLAFVVNPHAPSGRLESLDALRAMADAFKGVLVIDEAYIDFAPEDYESGIALIAEGRENVVVLRSLSKGYALAGLRFGYGLASTALVASLDKARDSYNLDALAQAAATAALQDQPYARGRWAQTRGERDRLIIALKKRGFETPVSHTNFVLSRVPTPGPTAGDYYRALKEAGILIRYFNTPRLADRLRMTVGTADQNDALLTALDRVSGC
ncbi:MAG: aminotransferase class I/II-fold pyridoxal phosphate-dependent enzyme [Algisphaera sp.]